MVNKRYLSAFLALTIASGSSIARENIGQKPKNTAKVITNSSLRVTAPCNEPTAQTDLQINNVRARIFSAGDMWWDLNESAGTAQYEIPKGTGKTSLFAGSVWIGGYDATGNLKVAGQTYRQQDANDFFTGPIGVQGGNMTTDVAICNQYDRLWSVTKQQVRDFIATGVATRDIREWPGNGDQSRGELPVLAPYEDVNGDGVYIPDSGDYPRYLLSGDYAPDPNDPNKLSCDDYIFGDQTLWWIFNDIGNVKKETNSAAIGLEFHAQAFAFNTDDEINNMTFYKYKIINRSNIAFDSTYFGWWVDPDLGDAFDDYVGCDVGLGLGYCYNGDPDDGSGTVDGYGLNPPAVGADFFQGPLADANDGVDNDRDGVVDEPGEQIIMSQFCYYNNDFTPFGNPETFDDYYQYLTGSWKTGVRWSRDGQSGQTPPTSTNPPTNYMFPGTTDPAFPGSNWTEATANNTPYDRRFLQSAGEFTLQAGAVNYITVGMVWARTTNGGPLASVDLLKLSDNKSQSLFDACFKTLDGPDAPDVQITELSNKIILSLKNFNNERIEKYSQLDPSIPTLVQPDEELRKFKFQGYLIFQVKDASVNTADIFDPSKTTATNILSGDKYKLIKQIDLKDTVEALTNYYWSPDLQGYRPLTVAFSGAQVVGANSGLTHSFIITDDAFTNKPLVNHKSYYYIVVSYAYNNFKPFEYIVPNSSNFTQQKPMKVGRNNIKVMSAIPHDPAVEYTGLSFNSEVGDGVEVTRLEGSGNGGLIIDMKDASVQEALNPPYVVANPVYEMGKGPLNVTVYDPLYAKHGHFEIKLNGVSGDSYWNVKETETNSVDTATYPISQPNSQILQTRDLNDLNKVYEWGLTADISNSVIEAGDAGAINNGLLDQSITFTNPDAAWLTGVADRDTTPPDARDWIRSGVDPNDIGGADPNQVYEGLIGGTWSPYKLANKTDAQFGPRSSTNQDNQLTLSGPKGITSVDVVFTSDKSKWTRAVVLEMGQPTSATIGNAPRFQKRRSASINKDGSNNPAGPVSTDPNDPNYIDNEGMGWFPGYAINIETGERLNIAYGENSVFTDQNSQDMQWNPTSTMLDANGNPVFGGMHYIWIFGSRNTQGARDIGVYDACEKFNTLIKSTTATERRDALANIIWTSIPLLANGRSLLETDAKVRLRVARQYRVFNTNFDSNSYINLTGTGSPLTRGQTYYIVNGTVTAAFNNNAITYSPGQTITIPTDANTFPDPSITSTNGVVLAPTLNGANPYYNFISGENVAPTLDNKDVAKNALSLINVVPNPYYAYSSYDKNTNLMWVKITNLPAKCTVSIYTMNGTLVRRYKRDAAPTITGEAVGLSQGTEAGSGNYDTSIDWDLKNSSNVPISSGVYLINVQAPGLGERTLKWFGVMRPISLDSY
ncbi:MAG TPA: hypothetical protein PKN14_06575 [Bacteroidia bacterium]|nr:hypothetical protein [Bacteroidia bacterium]HNT82641.1 hypothetical protein [Bacteroidia bacterium]